MSNYPLRLPDHIMMDAKLLAEQQGTSLNQFLSSLIAERVGEMKALEHIQNRMNRANKAMALAIFNQVPDRPPLPGDEILPS
jgi:ferritin